MATTRISSNRATKPPACLTKETKSIQSLLRITSELIADCFALARDIREVDMRASPYDLQKLGFAPIAIETAAGRAEYESHQRAFASRGEPLRARLVALCERLLR